MLSKVVGANAILMEYINNKVEALDAERRRLQEEVISLTHQPDSNNMNVITNHVEQWSETTFEDKQAVVDALIKVITIAGGNIEITWNI
ncbi:MAG: hypothetical protein Q4C00_04545 [Bacillota bacterium]|nr:hypothetical protein [Bacillota bacterium]